MIAIVEMPEYKTKSLNKQLKSYFMLFYLFFLDWSVPSISLLFPTADTVQQLLAPDLRAIFYIRVWQCGMLCHVVSPSCIPALLSKSLRRMASFKCFLYLSCTSACPYHRTNKCGIKKSSCASICWHLLGRQKPGERCFLTEHKN